MLRKPLSNREIEHVLEELQTKSRETIDGIREVRGNKIIQDFQEMTKAQILALTASQREVLIFKVLKALCWNTYE